MAVQNRVFDNLRHKIIVSCQPVVGGPMDRTSIVTSQALAAELGGAGGLRLSGIETVRSVSSVCSVPIIGITKRTLGDSPIRITPYLEDVENLVTAGAGIVAFDATQRERPTATRDIIRRIHELGALAMADCACVEDARQARAEGADILGTTLSGYAYDVLPENAPPDLELVKAVCAWHTFVIAEGRYRQPDDAAAAIQAGADAVVVGSAITRVEHITEWFSDAIAGVVAELADVSHR